MDHPDDPKAHKISSQVKVPREFYKKTCDKCPHDMGLLEDVKTSAHVKIECALQKLFNDLKPLEIQKGLAELQESLPEGEFPECMPGRNSAKIEAILDEIGTLKEIITNRTD